MSKIAALYGAGKKSLQAEAILARYAHDMRVEYLVENRDFGKLGARLSRIGGSDAPLAVISLAKLKKLYAGSECHHVIVPAAYSIHDLREISKNCEVMGIDRKDLFAVPYNRLMAPLDVDAAMLPPLVPFDRLMQIWQMDIHVADHCNLRCKACGHFSCLVEEPVLHDVETVSTSLAKLAKLVPNICNVSVLGGEPLLHPDLAAMLNVVRKEFPFTAMTMTTNGILLKQMPEELIASLKANRVTVGVSLYPPMNDEVDDIAAWLKAAGFAFSINRSDCFERRLLPRPAFDKQRMFAKCGHNMCLRGSRVGYCVIALFTDYYNKRFGAGRLPEDRGVDVFAHDDGESFLSALNRPLELCRQCVACDAGKQYFHGWEPAGKNPRPEDWFVNFPFEAALAREGE